jgi:aspartyl aminopeptidase
MEVLEYNTHLFEFLVSSPSPFHAVAGMETTLIANGFTRLEEKELWQLERGRPYFLSKSQGALIAFILGKEESVEDGFRILAAHTDSPCL